MLQQGMKNKYNKQQLTTTIRLYFPGVGRTGVIKSYITKMKTQNVTSQGGKSTYYADVLYIILSGTYEQEQIKKNPIYSKI